MASQVEKMTTLLTPLLAAQGLPQPVREGIQQAIAEGKNPLSFDVWIYRAVVVFLGVSVLVTVIGGIALVFAGKGSIPEAIVAIGSASVGAMAGLLAPSPRQP